MHHPNEKWLGSRLWFLTELPLQMVYAVFCDNLGYRRVTIKAKRTLKLKQINEGKIMSPERPHNYEKGMSPEQIADVIDPDKAGKLGKIATDQLIDEQTRNALHSRLDEAIDEANISPGAISSIKITGGEHTGYIKNSDGEIEYTEPLKRKGFSFSIEADRLDAPLMRVSSKRLPKKESLKGPTDQKTCVILPDLQMPFQDDEAVSVALQIVRDIRPDKVILLGDAVDLAAWSRFPQRPEHQQTTQDSLVKLHQLLASTRQTLPSSEIVVLEGNHDFRMHAKIMNDNPEALYLKRANDPDGYPVMSVPYLTSMDELDVEYISGYPANRHWINERLQVQHGAKARSGGSTAKAISNDERTSVIFGHVHRIEHHEKTVDVYGGARQSFAHTPGCLCRIDGAVPSTKGGTTIKGESVTKYEDWQQGLCVVTYQDGDSPFHLEQVNIQTFSDYETNYRGKVYKPKKEILPYDI